MVRPYRASRWLALALLALLAAPAAPQTAATNSGDEPEAEKAGGEDENPRSLVVFNIRLQHIELGDGNAADLLLFRRAVAIRRPRRPGVRFATLRFDLPVGQTRIGGDEATGLGDFYFQALNFRDLSRRFSLGSGLAFPLPPPTHDLLRARKRGGRLTLPHRGRRPAGRR